ncbi:MAG: hypothetical protein ACJAYO_001921, partial [Thalassolituus oleivorans]
PTTGDAHSFHDLQGQSGLFEIRYKRGEFGYNSRVVATKLSVFT